MYEMRIIMKKMLCIALILSFGLVMPRSRSSAKVNEENFAVDVLSKQEADLINFFYRPIDFSQEGINYYFRYVYNHPEYVNYLPYNLSHMIQFLEHGAKSDQSEAFAASIVKLFMQKIKATPYIDAESFAEFLPRLAISLKPYLEKKEASFLQEMQKVLKERLTSVFSKYFSYFQKNPDGFMTSLAEQIAKQTNHLHTQQHVEIEQLKKDILKFIEFCANKLVWSSKDDLQVWYICNKLAYEAQQCLEKGVLTEQDALDDVAWSLIHRFCYFVELAAPTLSREFYESVLSDLRSKPLILTAVEEQEDLITPKREYLANKIQMYRDVAFPKQNADMQFDESKFQEGMKADFNLAG